jgi:hypothetical protein
MAIAKDIAYKRYEKMGTNIVAVPTASDFVQALMQIYGKKRKNISMKCIEKVMQHQTQP